MSCDVKHEISSNWTDEEDLQLLCGIERHGLNWKAVSASLDGRSPESCEDRFHVRFIETGDSFEGARQSSALCSNNCKLTSVYDARFAKLYSHASFLEGEDFVHYLNTKSTKRPSNIPLASANDIRHKIGRMRHHHSFFPPKEYHAARSEFSVEFDNKAELVLGLMREENEGPNEVDPDDDFLIELKTSLVSSYLLRLKEREKRKKVVRNHALIDRRKTYTMNQRFDVAFGTQNLRSLFRFMQFLRGPDLDYLFESLKYQCEVKSKINNLTNYRNLGLKMLNSVKLYERMHKKRIKNKRELDSQMFVIDIDLLTSSRSSKRSAAPLDIHNLPGYSSLDGEERELCSNNRIVPETFLSFKSVLIGECRKHDGLKLVQARQLIKMDVNKTRKMFDYLIAKELIWPPKET